MANINTAVRGTSDILPGMSEKFAYAERIMSETAALYGFREIRVPVFEHTEVFTRSVGETTDVVQKEMYTFEDKGGRSITLRPEGTAGVVRSLIESGLAGGALPQKLYYILNCYRYEKPQAGRYREFRQFGVECFGAPDPAADAEIIALGANVISSLGIPCGFGTGAATPENGSGIPPVELQLNSIGCPDCRAVYHKALLEYFNSCAGSLCATCRDRLTRNPMRILDCKSPVCGEISSKAPVMLDYLDGDCRAHFESVKAHLSAAGVGFVINPRIVRGLDYYTRTVFEFVSNQIGSQGTICAGGRYDGLVSQMGGPSLPSLGFAMGVERMLMVMEAAGSYFPETKGPELYIVPAGDDARIFATKLCAELRGAGISALTDLAGRSVKAQMKFANKTGAAAVAVIGDDELSRGSVQIKEMQTGESREVAFNKIKDALSRGI